jgi:hypothetical protein
VNVIPSPGREISNTPLALSTEKLRPYGCILNSILFFVALDISCTRMVDECCLAVLFWQSRVKRVSILYPSVLISEMNRHPERQMGPEITLILLINDTSQTVGGENTKYSE